MEKIPTAREFYDKHDSDDCVVMMIEFAKLHCEAQAEAITWNVEINDYDEHFQYSPHVDKNSILNSYPLENIK